MGKMINREDLVLEIAKSWDCIEGTVHSTEDIIKWVDNRNKSTKVDVKETSISQDTFWFYDDYKGEILNRKRSFFSITGARYFINGKYIDEQPIILQPEIGFLGIIAKKIDGVFNFLMQAKIEPGNVNCVQISPTLQATKSNFTRLHGGSLPPYFGIFEKTVLTGEYILYDQIQSEQNLRFLGKRNRNIIIFSEDEIQEDASFRWMTLGQIKQLMQIDNLVNMDTRTVISGLSAMYYTSRGGGDDYFYAMSHLNNYKMYNESNTILTPLNQLSSWYVNDRGVFCKGESDYEIRFYNIEIDGREVKKWMQPLFVAKSKAVFVLMYYCIRNTRYYLLSKRPAVGCFDKIEFGPSIQLANNEYDANDPVQQYFWEGNGSVIKDVILSEEGGRFYHEENRNVIVEVEEIGLRDLPNNYCWLSEGTVGRLGLTNNYLNIQLRSLLSLLDRS